MLLFRSVKHSIDHLNESCVYGSFNVMSNFLFLPPRRQNHKTRASSQCLPFSRNLITYQHILDFALRASAYSNGKMRVNLIESAFDDAAPDMPESTPSLGEHPSRTSCIRPWTYRSEFDNLPYVPPLKIKSKFDGLPYVAPLKIKPKPRRTPLHLRDEGFKNTSPSRQREPAEAKKDFETPTPKWLEAFVQPEPKAIEATKDHEHRQAKKLRAATCLSDGSPKQTCLSLESPITRPANSETKPTNKRDWDESETTTACFEALYDLYLEDTTVPVGCQAPDSPTRTSPNVGSQTCMRLVLENLRLLSLEKGEESNTDFALNFDSFNARIQKWLDATSLPAEECALQAKIRAGKSKSTVSGFEPDGVSYGLIEALWTPQDIIGSGRKAVVYGHQKRGINERATDASKALTRGWNNSRRYEDGGNET